MDNRPIGLIDSGIGGFTVLKELQLNFPKEDFIYFGDSKNMPYGEKTNEEIVELVNKDIDFLINKGVKIIILACNTASSLIDKLNDPVELFSIIDAGCLATIGTQDNGKVGLIATNATVRNKAYDKIIKNYSDNIEFISYGTPTLAQVINNQLDEIKLLKRNINLAIDPILQQYPISNLLLGCTHFPIVSKTIKEMYPNLNLINPAIKEVEIVENYLTNNNMVNETNTPSVTEIYLSNNKTNNQMDYKLLDELNINYNLVEEIN